MLLFFLVLSLSSAKDDTSSWTNGRYTTSRTRNPEVGETLYLSAQVKAGTNELWDSTCHVITPTGEEWSVSSGGHVYDEDYNDVPGVKGRMEVPDQCWVSITTAAEEHFGNWRIEIFGHNADDGLYMDSPWPAFFITTDNLVTDIRLPTTFIPKHYDVRLIPDFESTGSSIKYEGSVTMLFLDLRYEDTKLLSFHMDELTLAGKPTACWYDSNSYCRMESLSYVIYDFQRTLVHLESYTTFKSEQEYKVSLNFTADISSRGGYYTYGFYPQMCSETSGDPKLCWFTQVSCHSCHTSCHEAVLVHPGRVYDHQKRLPLPGRARDESHLQPRDREDGGVPCEDEQPATGDSAAA